MKILPQHFWRPITVDTSASKPITKLITFFDSIFTLSHLPTWEVQKTTHGFQCMSEMPVDKLARIKFIAKVALISLGIFYKPKETPSALTALFFAKVLFRAKFPITHPILPPPQHLAQQNVLKWFQKFYSRCLFQLFSLGICDYTRIWQAPEEGSKEEEEEIIIKIGENEKCFPLSFIKRIPLFYYPFECVKEDLGEQRILHMADDCFMSLKTLERLQQFESAQDLPNLNEAINSETLDYLGLSMTNNIFMCFKDYAEFQEFIFDGKEDKDNSLMKHIEHLKKAPPQVKCESNGFTFIKLQHKIEKEIEKLEEMLSEPLGKNSKATSEEGEILFSLKTLLNKISSQPLKESARYLYVNRLINAYLIYLNDVRNQDKELNVAEQVLKLFAGDDNQWKNYVTILQLPASFDFTRMKDVLFHFPNLHWLSIQFFAVQPHDFLEWFRSFKEHCVNLRVLSIVDLDGYKNEDVFSQVLQELPNLEIFEW